MKKLSAVQVKQQALVLNVADKIEEQGVLKSQVCCNAGLMWNIIYFQVLY
jgi:hypothetical protein